MLLLSLCPTPPRPDPEYFRLCPTLFRPREESVREVRGEEEVKGEVDGEEEEGVEAVGEVLGDGEEAERPLVCAFVDVVDVGWSRRCWRSVEESSKASAPRLANNALAWLEEALSDGSSAPPLPPLLLLLLPPSWGYLRSPVANRDTAVPPEEGKRPEKLAARVPVRRGSVRKLPPRA